MDYRNIPITKLLSELNSELKQTIVIQKEYITVLEKGDELSKSIQELLEDERETRARYHEAICKEYELHTKALQITIQTLQDNQRKWYHIF